MLKCALYLEDEGQPNGWSHQTPYSGNPRVQQVSNQPMVCEENDWQENSCLESIPAKQWSIRLAQNPNSYRED